MASRTPLELTNARPSLRGRALGQIVESGGHIVVAILRLSAYTLLALFRCVSSSRLRANGTGRERVYNNRTSV